MDQVDKLEHARMQAKITVDGITDMIDRLRHISNYIHATLGSGMIVHAIASMTICFGLTENDQNIFK